MSVMSLGHTVVMCDPRAFLYERSKERWNSPWQMRLSESNKLCMSLQEGVATKHKDVTYKSGY